MLDAIRKVIGWRYFYLVFYAAISLLILDGLLLPGYILSLDMSWPTHFDISDSFYGLKEFFVVVRSGFPLGVLMVVLNYVLPAWVIQKIVLFSAIFVSGVAAHKLCPTGSLGKYFAGLLYMINPFTYVRFLAGQRMLVLAYSVTPLAIFLFLKFLENPSIKRTALMVLGTTLVAIFNIQVLIIVLLAYMVFFGFKAVARAREGKFSPLLKATPLAVTGFFLLNFYWLLPVITVGIDPTSGIGPSDVPVFAPHATGLSVAFSVASMHGFWREGYLYAKDIIPGWYIFFLFILFLGSYGLVSNFKSPHIKAFAVIWAVSLILAVGASSPFAFIFNFLFDHIPLFKGFRDSQKFVVLLVLSYAYLGGLGLADLKDSFGKLDMWRKRVPAIVLVVLALITPFIYSITMFNGFWGQLRPTDYPRDWYQVNDVLNQDKDDFKMLFLPFHWYMDFSWVPNRDKRLDNPAKVFFDKDTIRGENIEVPGVYTQSTDPTQHYLSFLLEKRNDIDNLGMLIAPLNIKYVILTKEADYQKYSFLFEQKDMELIKETETLYLFQNKHPTAKFYEADQLSVIKNWEELLRLSQKEDITKKVYIIGEQSNLSTLPSESRPLAYEKTSPLRYFLTDKPEKNYIIFTEAYRQDWQLDGQQPLANLGITNAYKIQGIARKNLIYTRFNIHLVGYVVSVLALAGLLYGFWGVRKN